MLMFIVVFSVLAGGFLMLGTTDTYQSTRRKFIFLGAVLLAMASFMAGALA